MVSPSMGQLFDLISKNSDKLISSFRGSKIQSSSGCLDSRPKMRDISGAIIFTDNSWTNDSTGIQKNCLNMQEHINETRQKQTTIKWKKLDTNYKLQHFK